MSENYENMTNKEIKEQLEWSDHHEFSYNYAIWAFEEIDKLNDIIETYKNANEYHQNKIEELEKLLRKTPGQLISENVDLRAKNNRLNNIINELEKDIKNLYTYGIKNNAEQRDYLLNRLDGFKALKENNK